MKNFVKLIQQIHKEKYSIIERKIIEEKIPVTFLSIKQSAQAVKEVENFRAQGVNITNLLITDKLPVPDLDFNVIHVSNAAQIYPPPEYVLVTGSYEFKFAKKFMGNVKIILPNLIRGQTTDKVFDIFMEHLHELYEVYESLIDEESKKTFRGYWLGCITNQINEVVYANTPQYICPGFLPKPGSVFIDCGTYDGGTALRFKNMGCEIYGFEINRDFFKLAANSAAKNNFVVENLGLGSFEHESKYISATAASRLDPGGSESVNVMTLDRYVGKKNLPRVDFIKMDVEGAELDILKGAAITITRFKPILAISAYHKLDDFWTLTNFIKSLRPDYEFAMRHYATTPEDISDWFSRELIDFLEKFDLEINCPTYEDCVLFAR